MNESGTAVWNSNKTISGCKDGDVWLSVYSGPITSAITYVTITGNTGIVHDLELSGGSNTV
jgi:hypothetical protein